MNKSLLVDYKQTDKVKNELNILSTIEHPFVIKFKGFCQNNQSLMYGLEYIPGGELFTHLRNKGFLSHQEN